MNHFPRDFTHNTLSGEELGAAMIYEIKETEIVELKKFHKSYFDVESITNTASELKYSMS
jgi:hypothetical protein